ncbi:hypothetical protein NDU88_005684 [Pleurodeles waltl]|uniref:Uncharacterized protein n=1 Tax=Pleurodeles waltl TaxID=8319 RepID=A0AAV7MHN2_PLEWA|nr:hypothetical protein NDU88_005684 [Pleurodeles waltl]
MHNGEDAEPKKEEDDVPKEGDEEEESMTLSEAGWKADGGVWILQPCHAPGRAWLDKRSTGESREGDQGCTFQPNKREKKKEQSNPTILKRTLTRRNYKDNFGRLRAYKK